VGLIPGTDQVERRGPVIGIIDPFLQTIAGLAKGARVWLWLYPGTITGLRHDWTCPAVDEVQKAAEAAKVAATKEEHEKWLRDFAVRNKLSYDELVKEAASTGGYVVSSDGNFPYSLDHDEREQFWEHLEAMTDKTFNAHHRQSIVWSCSC
jgi:hypothetical protein